MTSHRSSLDSSQTSPYRGFADSSRPESAVGSPRRSKTTSGVVGAATESAVEVRPKFEDSPSIQWATPGDYPAIHAFLLSVAQGPSREEFQASVDDPFHEPTDRLLIKESGRIAAHACLQRRTIFFGGGRVPVARLTQLATAAEFRGRGFARRLIEAAERQMGEDLTQIGLLTTETPQLFERLGWAVCSADSYSRASAPDVLACLPPSVVQGEDRVSEIERMRRPTPEYAIRPWRHFELPALERIYRAFASHRVGPLDRSEAYWRWLASRRAFDQIFVASTESDAPEAISPDGAACDSIVAYAAVRDQRIVEIAASSEHPLAEASLLARLCADAMEGNDLGISVHAPADHPLHEILVTAGGRFQHDDPRRLDGAPPGAGRAVHMAKLLDPSPVLATASAHTFERARGADLPRPCSLSVESEGSIYSLSLTRRSARWTDATTAEKDAIRCDRSVLLRLLLGQIDVREAIARRLVVATTAAAKKIAAAVFPPDQFYLPPFDQLQAR
jgi:predicted acetyltransferase